jgi:Domain of unknown function DUF29
MAKALSPPAATELYEKDFLAWAQRQSELLRAHRFDELDLEHLIEEVADLGVSERHAVMNRVRQILEHFLKLEYSPAEGPRRGWKETIDTQRMDLEEILSPSLRHELEGEFSRLYSRARRGAARGLKPDRIQERQLPRTCPYTLDQVLAADWLPTCRHGIDDEAG